MTRAELLAVAKPILLNTEMVQAVKDNRKTVTRRVIKPQPTCPRFNNIGWLGWDDGHGYKVHQPYRPGDILYVRETWNCLLIPEPLRGTSKTYWYKADGATPEDKWHPSIHMPKEAARIFLRVTGVRVERLQDITEEQAKAEGAVKAYPYTDPITRETVFAESKYGTYLAGFECLWNKCYAAPRGVKDRRGVITHYESYPFEEIRETRTYKSKPWYVIGNPWVWGYEFEVMEVEQ